MSMRGPGTILIGLALLCAEAAAGQPCLVSYTLTANPMPVGGSYQGGQTVNFCFTVTNWNSTNANWFHGLVPSFGPGWDMSTLVPGPPPATCGPSTGNWGWYNTCSGTATTAIGPVGPGWFFDLNNDGNPGNNFGDYCVGAVNWMFCWSITVAGGANCVDGADLTIMVNTYGDSETGSWSSSGCTGDAIVPTPAAVSNCCDADAGSDASITTCASAAPFDLFALLGGTPDPGGSWTDPNGSTTSSLLDPTTAISGAYTYEVVDVLAQCSSQAVVNVTVAAQPNAGMGTSIDLCSDGPSTDLFALLGPGADVGGTWSGPGALTGNLFDPLSGTPGIYTYTVGATPPCVDATATVTVNVAQAPDAGANGAIALCSDGPTIPLFVQLAGTPEVGGVWTDPNGSINFGLVAPAVDPSGAYIYTVAGIAPCVNAQAQVIVTINTAPEAGVGGQTLLCSAQSPTDLYDALGGNPNIGGAWTDPNGNIFIQPLDPGGALQGTYTYTVNGTIPCASDQATVTVTIEQQPSAGSDGVITVCDQSGPFDLFAELLGMPDAGGTWTDPNGIPVTSTFTPGTSIPGGYTYSVQANAPCTTVDATVAVTVNNAPDAGADGLASVCSADPSFALIDMLGGNPQANGVWTDPNGNVHGGSFQPGSDPDGTYTYTIAGTSPCASASAQVQVTTYTAPDAGSNSVLNVCLAGAPVDLFAELGGTPDGGGSWTDPNGVATNGIFDPGSDPPGPYTYSVTGSGPCPSVSALVQVNVTAQPDAGLDASIAMCSSDPVLDLFNELGGMPDPGGTWTDPNGMGTTALIDPATATPGAYSYTLVAPPPCISVSATVTLSISSAVPNGLQGQMDLCASDPPADLLQTLPGIAGTGLWTDPNGNTHSGSCDPAIDPAGTYTYILAGTSPCPDGVQQVDVQIIQPPDAGSNGSMDLCTSAPPAPLFNALAGNPDVGGTWAGPGGIVANSTFDPSTDPPGVYTYTVNGTAPCPATTADVTVTTTPASDAGGPGTLSVCALDNSVDLFPALAGSPSQNGTWTDPNGAPITMPIDASMVPTGNYTYTVPGIAPCPDASAVVQLMIDPAPNAGNDGQLIACADGASVSLLNALGGAPDPGGSWSDPGGNAHTVQFDPDMDDPGVYTYMVMGGGACTGLVDEALVDMVIMQAMPILIEATPMQGCAPLTVHFTPGTTPGVAQLVWDLGDGSMSSSLAPFDHSYSHPGSFPVQVVVTDQNGCTTNVTLMGTIMAQAGPSVAVHAEPLVVSTSSPTVHLVGLAPPGDSLLWTSDGLAIGSDVVWSYTFDPATAGYHTICLTATDDASCSNETCVEVLVDEEMTVYVPEAFTPNGDGVNEAFRPSLLGVDENDYELLIFDRWGEMVFSTHDPNESWNGGLHNDGRPLPDGVYVWRIRARDKFSATRKAFIGHVTLLK
ncbi:MAG: gliding motility-associated C-terminal domain-containing protein [Flavobacteriales bacterium]|nr:gliding motility-associated C-terminal domain-containing protein [Flavobacteriales bacterium]